MQYGVPAHFNYDARNYLGAAYTGRWAGQQGTAAWPSRSPDLSPLHYFLYGHLKKWCNPQQRNHFSAVKVVIPRSASISESCIVGRKFMWQ
jgi:hypothetical protein